MASKLIVLISMTSFLIFIPVLLALMNFNDYTVLNTKPYQDLTSSDFNIVSFKGVSVAFTLILDLGKFSISGLHPIFTAFFLIMSLISIIVLVLLVRGTS